MYLFIKQAVLGRSWNLLHPFVADNNPFFLFIGSTMRTFVALCLQSLVLWTCVWNHGVHLHDHLRLRHDPVLTTAIYGTHRTFPQKPPPDGLNSFHTISTSGGCLDLERSEAQNIHSNSSGGEFCSQFAASQSWSSFSLKSLSISTALLVFSLGSFFCCCRFHSFTAQSGSPMICKWPFHLAKQGNGLPRHSTTCPSIHGEHSFLDLVEYRSCRHG